LPLLFGSQKYGSVSKGGIKMTAGTGDRDGRKLSDYQVIEWGNRNDVREPLTQLRAMVEDARTMENKPHPQVAPTFPDASDCEHGCHRGKCPECERDRLQIQLDAWHTIFGNSQLSHAKARLDVAEAKYDRLLAVLRNEKIKEEVADRQLGAWINAINAFSARVLAEVEK
jgi:tRNA(His) 5'-end guanylyltransferase